MGASRLKTFAQSLTAEQGWPTRLLGYSLYQCWFMIFCMGGLVRAYGVVGGMVFSGAHAVNVLVVALVSIVILLGTRRLVPLSRHKELGIPIALAGVAGTALAFLASMGIVETWGLFAGMGVGASTAAWIALSWEEYLSTQGVRCAMATFACSSVIGCLLLLVLGVVPRPVLVVVECLLPLASELLLRPRRGTRFYANTETISERAILGNVFRDHSPRLFALYACVGAAYGMVSEVCVPYLAASTAGGMSLMSWGGAACIVALTYAVAGVLVGTARAHRVTLFLYPGIGLMMVAVALSALVPVTSAVPAFVLGSLGFNLVLVVLWALMVESSHAHRLPVLALLAMLSSSRFLGMTVGQLCGVACAGEVLLFAVTALCILVVASLLFASLPRELSVSPEVFEAPVRTSQEKRIIELSERCKLTPRETEVLQVWLAGHNAAYVEETLHISRNTVKTHVNHIYQKVGVGSREELLGLLAD